MVCLRSWHHQIYITRTGDTRKYQHTTLNLKAINDSWVAWLGGSLKGSPTTVFPFQEG